MKTDVSFIISIDSSFEMLNIFFEHLLQDEFALNSEIIVILDAITNCNIITYIKNLSKQTPNIKVYISDKKLGYGKANNYAVKQATCKKMLLVKRTKSTSCTLYSVILRNFITTN